MHTQILNVSVSALCIFYFYSHVHAHAIHPVGSCQQQSVALVPRVCILMLHYGSNRNLPVHIEETNTLSMSYCQNSSISRQLHTCCRTSQLN